MKTKLFTLLLTIVASVGIMFASNTQVNGIWYNFDSSTQTAEVTYRGTTESTYNNEYTGSVVIPASVSYDGRTYSVTSIGKNAFYGCSGLTSVRIGNSVTRIGDYAFSYCRGLTSMTISNSVTSIGWGAFYNCSGLTSVTIGNSVTSIDCYAFNNCTGLTSVTIPNSVTSIGNGAFDGCSGFPVIDNIRYADTYLIEAVDKTLSTYTIKDGTKWIGCYAFSGCRGLTSVTIPNSVTSIGNYAFESCTGLTYIEIPNSVTSIEGRTFYNCTGLTSVTIPNSVTSIGDGAFYRVNNIVYTGSARSYYPWGAKSVNGYVEGYLVYNDATKTKLLGCSSAVNGEIVIPNSVTSIGSDAFLSCRGLTSVTIPNSVTSIGGSAFNGCSNITSVVWNAKSCNSLNFGSQVTSFTFGDSVEIIPANLCTSMNKLTSVTIPNSVTSIGGSAFSGCSGLTSVTIGNSVNNIGDQAFSGCTGLTSVTIPNSVTNIGGGAFSGCTGLTSVSIGNSVTNIGGGAFSGCTGLTSVSIGNSVTNIGSDAFENSGVETINFIGSIEDWCNKIWSPNCISSNYQLLFNGVIQKNVIIPSSVTSIGNNVFSGCNSLTSVTIGNSVTSIGNNAFSGCNSLTSVTIGNSVNKIESSAFQGCSGLTSVALNSQAIVGKNYSPSSNIKNIFGSQVTQYIIGDDVTSIGGYAFYNCTGLTSVTIPNSVTDIEYCAFQGCSGLTSVTCWAPTPPTCLFSSCFSGVNCSNIPLYVPMESVSLYQAAYIWKEFNVIGVMFADEVETAVFSATPTDDYGVILEWQAVENAVLYNIDIIQGNDTIRKLQFDSNGKLLNNPSNAPSRYANIRYSSTAILSGNGWRCEVNDLDPGTNYTYSITVKAENGSVLYSQSIGFTTKEETFIIKFVNWNGEELLVLPEVVKGTTPSYTGETPVRPNTAEYTYTFVGWTPAIVAATSDTTYTATYTATKNSYTITWQNEDGSLIDQTTVEYGVVPTHAEPTKEATEEYTYTFAGWTPAVVAVTGDTTYKATFTATKNNYTITWLDEDGSLIDQTTVEYGVVPTHAEPTKEATEEYTYTFSGWTPAIVAVTGDATYKATFSSVVNVYTISVSAANGQVIGGGEYQYGATIDLTAIPDEGYVFDQWSDGVKDNPRTITVTGDAEYTALFTSTEGFENIYTSEPVQKVIIDQKVYILRDEKVYNAQGALVK